MKIIKNLIDIDLKHESKDHLIINGNNGLCDIIHTEDYDYIRKWISTKHFDIVNDNELKLYNYFLDRGYIISDDVDEYAIRLKICEKIRKINEKKLSERLRVHFILTYDCNFDCPYCYEKSRRVPDVLSKEQVDSVFELYNNKIDRIGLFGGEPLLPKNSDVIKHIANKAPDATYSIISNGYYLKEYIDILKSIQVEFLQVTIDGMKSSHNQTRIPANKKPTYDKIMNGLEECLNNNIPINIRMNVTPANIDNCIEEKMILEKRFKDKSFGIEMMPIFQCHLDEKAKLYEKLFGEDVVSENKNPILQHLPTISNFLYNGGNTNSTLKRF